MDNLDHIEHELQKLAIKVCTPIPTEPLKEVIQLERIQII